MSDKNDKKDTPMQAMWMSLTGASAHLHEEIPGIDAKSQGVGHEPDEFGLRTITSVPTAVTVTLLLPYLIAPGTSRFITGRGETPAKANPFNARAVRISSAAR